MSRVMGALAFRRKVYSEVEHEAGLTNMAWLLVVVANFLGQLLYCWLFCGYGLAAPVHQL
jgi:hypothetical protein